MDETLGFMCVGRDSFYYICAVHVSAYVLYVLKTHADVSDILNVLLFREHIEMQLQYNVNINMLMCFDSFLSPRLSESSPPTYKEL